MGGTRCGVFMPRDAARVGLIRDERSRIVRGDRDGLAVATPERALDHFEEWRLVVLSVEAGGEPDRIAGVEAHILGHPLGKRLARRVPRQLEERDAILG